MDRFSQKARHGVRPALLGSLLCSGVAASAQADSQAEPPRWSEIAFEMHSWGNLLSSWTVNADGSGRWTGLDVPGQAPADPAVLPDHALDVGPAGYRALETLLRKLPEPAPNFQPCEQFMTDQPYGIIRLTSGVTTTEIAWNAGCMDKNYMPFLDTLRAGNDMVAAWGRKGKLLPK